MLFVVAEEGAHHGVGVLRREQVVRDARHANESADTGQELDVRALGAGRREENEEESNRLVVRPSEGDRGPCPGDPEHGALESGKSRVGEREPVAHRGRVRLLAAL